jgi:hypothetical protein
MSEKKIKAILLNKESVMSDESKKKYNIKRQLLIGLAIIAAGISIEIILAFVSRLF